MNEEEKQELETLRAEKLRREQVERARAALERGGVPQSFASLLAGGDDGDTDRRTEEFRAEAIEKLRAIIGQQRIWCQKQRGEYAFMSEAILQDIRRAEDVLENADYSGFDQMMEGLQQLEDTLQ